mmetsp:Transcript_15428/g.27622  ORF Transcript_15428/g.27622 Transcript_15428/m.27622 type:complete len:444 (-) Transcript_15428:282-1613(-)
MVRVDHHHLDMMADAQCIVRHQPADILADVNGSPTASWRSFGQVFQYICNGARSPASKKVSTPAESRARIETVLQFLNGKGPDSQIPGLANLGNTCFMNAVLQCLLNTPGRLLESCTAFADLNPNGIAEKGLLGLRFAELATEYGLRDGGSLPRNSSALVGLKASMAALDSKYAGCQQQDAYEFLGCLLEGLDENFTAVLKAKFGSFCQLPLPPSGIVRSVCGVASHSTRCCQRCLECFEVDHSVDTVLRLPLISPEAQMDEAVRAKEETEPITLKELIDAAQKPEDIDGYDCDKCREIAEKAEVDHERSLVTQRAGLVSETRDILCIALYRFLNVMDEQGNFSAVKIQRRVAIPTVLSFETGEYRLYGVVSHEGSTLASGHYIAAVRSLRDHQWWSCSDAQVTPLHLRNLYEVSEITATKPDATPFILFYHRMEADMEFTEI